MKSIFTPRGGRKGLLFFKSLLLGLSIAAPVGPIGLLCINRTLNYGRLAGVLSGLGAATADTIYAAFAAFGFGLSVGRLVEQQTWTEIIGALFLIYIGVKIFMSKPASQAANVSGKNLINMFVSTWLLTMANPVTILSFVAMFAGLGFVEQTGSLGAAFTLVSGVFLGSSLWWLLLSGGVYIFKTRLMPYLGAINKMSGLLIVLLGTLSLLDW